MLYPFFKDGKISGGRCGWCDEKSPSDMRTPEDTDESIMQKLMAWIDQHICRRKI